VYVISGVPQGSVLGPLPFLIYNNDASELLCHDVKVKLFADDLKLYAAVDSDLDFDIWQSNLLLLAGWADKWQLEVFCIQM
jgi:ribonuclease P/MRP protein subunit RPP40